MYSGQILFIKRFFQDNTFEDTVNFDVVVEIESQNRTNTIRGGSYSLSFTWAFADIDIHPTTVSEENWQYYICYKVSFIVNSLLTIL